MVCEAEFVNMVCDLHPPNLMNYTTVRDISLRIYDYCLLHVHIFALARTLKCVHVGKVLMLLEVPRPAHTAILLTTDMHHRAASVEM